jgi:WD40 repeat protein
MWNLASDAKQIRTAGGHSDFVEKVRFHPTKPLIVSCSLDKTVRLWNPDNGAQIRSLEGHTDAVFAIAISPDGNRIASGAWNGEVRIWNVDDGKLIKSFIASPIVATAGK